MSESGLAKILDRTKKSLLTRIGVNGNLYILLSSVNAPFTEKIAGEKTLKQVLKLTSDPRIAIDTIDDYIINTANLDDFVAREKSYRSLLTALFSANYDCKNVYYTIRETLPRYMNNEMLLRALTEKTSDGRTMRENLKEVKSVLFAIDYIGQELCLNPSNMNLRALYEHLSNYKQFIENRFLCSFSNKMAAFTGK